MEEASLTPSPEERAFSDSAVDFDLMNELLSGDCWLDSSSYSDFLQPSTSAAPFSSSPLFSSLYEAINNGSIPPQSDAQDADFNPCSNGTPIGSSQLEPSSNWSIEPRSPIVPLRERLFHALKYIKDGQKGSEILVQIWVPTTTRRGDRDKHFLTTCGQPFWFDPNCLSLAKYRSVSTEYQFSAEANSSELLGLPGRVFIGKVPEWTPDVRYFSVEEYPRVDQAQRLNVSGTIALPVFEKDSQSCIGVVEVVLTTQKINYSSDVENICNALQAVNLRSSDVLRVPRVKVSDSSYQAALPEIRDVLKTVCETHGLPLAQTWITCVRQGKRGSRHSSENYNECVSTVDSACCVNDPSMFGFHEACSEHHLFRGQGVAGKAFTTNQPCFSPDITSFIKTQYPLSHHAKLFHLRAAVAIRLRSIHTGNADFVLEFFLPINCIESEEQKHMLDSLSITIRQVCRSLRVVTAKELDEEVMTEVNQSLPSILSFDEFLSEGGQRQVDGNMFSGISGEVPSWIGSVMELQEKENGSVLPASVCFEFGSQEKFAVSTEWDASESALPDGSIFSEFKGSQSSADQRGSFSTEPSCQRAGKATEKRRAKAEKTISLQVLRQYFAGSLKDAAKSLGVCPTTLKRICRQHGITRWPSRKIKKVGHSLKKLQVVIDSVQGAEGTFQFSSVYENFTRVSSPSKNSSGSYKTITTKQTDQPESSNLHRHTVSNSSSSTCSLSSNSSLGGSSGSKQRPHSLQFPIKQESSIEESQAVQLVRANSELNIPSQESPRAPICSQSHRAFFELPSQENRPQLLKRRSEDSFEKSPSQLLKRRPDVLKVKAVYGEEKVRFRLHSTWGFQELKQETLKRFNIGNICSVDLKYLDDDSEWVLLTCDADLQECIDVYKSFSCDTIKISLHHIALPVTRASFGPQQELT